MLGVVGAVAEFMPTAPHDIDLQLEDQTVRASTVGAELRFTLSDDVRALTHSATGDKSDQR
ncbi:MAG: hypothetical protein HWE30_16430 [Methylocystaceae bacterium]|nr:hypothetical protein [Methylocystaceae bacterium]